MFLVFLFRGERRGPLEEVILGFQMFLAVFSDLIVRAVSSHMSNGKNIGISKFQLIILWNSQIWVDSIYSSYGFQ